MRILHTSDWHLNERLGRIERQTDIAARLFEIAGYLEQHKVDVMVVSGDLFANITRIDAIRDAVGDVSQAFKPFLLSGGTIVGIPGNHDNEALFNLFAAIGAAGAPTDHFVTRVVASGFAPGTAYVTLSGQRFDKAEPWILRTLDFGKSWTRIVDGIAPEAWARVVREDPVRRDLLYLGTETGFYVSFNGGQRWTRLQLNLPLTPITDLKVHRNDLIASTAGRAFWILDDLSPLQQWTDATASTDVRLFTPRPAYRTQAFGGGVGGGWA